MRAGDERRARRREPKSAPRRTPAQRRYAAGRDRRRRLEASVIALLRERGVAGVTHRAVAEHAALPLASTTYYFETKADMLRAAFDAFTADSFRRLDRVLADYDAERITIPRAIDLIERVLAEEVETEEPAWVVEVELLLAAGRDPGLVPFYGEYQARLDVALRTLLRDLGSAHPTQDARLLLASLRGAELDALARTDHKAWKRTLRRDLRRLLRCLLEAANPPAR